MTWYREPDFAANYRDLWQVEQALSDTGQAKRFELLSTWRLAHDETYARWARDIGTEACQISVFGLEKNTDYFTRRRGSFKDNLVATERLLEVGIRPRWQIFLTKGGLPDLPALVELIETLELDRRVEQLGHEFEVFVRTPAPDGEAFNIEHLRPTVDALRLIPQYLVDKTLRFNDASTLEECVGRSEREWVAALSQHTEPFAAFPEILAFMVTPELDVYSNIGEPRPWWRLGNLKTDGIDHIMRCYETNDVPGLRANFTVPVSVLAQRYGRRDSQRVYGEGEIVLRWLRQWGEDCITSNE
jgi:MoaA/NifB/PqqE/SkfB family radical SAM enzyme